MMQARGCQPSPLLLVLMLALFVAGVASLVSAFVAPAIHMALHQVLLMVLLVLTGVAAGDWILSRRMAKGVSVERQLPHNMSVGRWNAIELRIVNRTRRSLALSLFDHFPASFICSDFPCHVGVAAGRQQQLRYHIKPLKRGAYEMSATALRLRSHWHLWDMQYHYTNPQSLRVLPDFKAMQGYDLLAALNRTSVMGVRRRHKGQGTDFHQLRAYQEGDALRQIDWKASARHKQLISREYRQERNQNLVILLDSGFRLRTRENGLSHFDYCLNAALMLAHVALDQGDAVGMMDMGETQTWVPPVKGQGLHTALLSSFYAVEAKGTAADYIHSAQALLTRQRRRSLVVLMSNLGDDDSRELEQAVELLKHRHLVLVVSLREPHITQIESRTVSDLRTALQYGEGCRYLGRRQANHQQIAQRGAILIDTSVDELTPALINQYLDIKDSGRL